MFFFSDHNDNKWNFWRVDLLWFETNDYFCINYVQSKLVVSKNCIVKIIIFTVAKTGSKDILKLDILLQNQKYFLH